MCLDLLGDAVSKLSRPAELALVNVGCWVTCRHTRNTELTATLLMTVRVEEHYMIRYRGGSVVTGVLKHNLPASRRVAGAHMGG